MVQAPFLDALGSAKRKPFPALGLLYLVALGPVACGPSGELLARRRDVDSLRNQLAAEQSQSQTLQEDLLAAQTLVEKLQAELSAAGVDFSNLHASMEQQARALDEYRRRAEQLDAVKRRFVTLKAKLQSMSQLGLNVTVRNNKMVIQLPGDLLFDPGKDALKPEGEELLLKVAEVIRADASLQSRTYQVAGHADEEKLADARLRDSWGLSAMRARSVLVFLTSPLEPRGGGLPEQHWSAAGYGKTDPLHAVDAGGSSGANRRVELIVMPNLEETLDLKELTRG